MLISPTTLRLLDELSSPVSASRIRPILRCVYHSSDLNSLTVRLNRIGVLRKRRLSSLLYDESSRTLSFTLSDRTTYTTYNISNTGGGLHPVSTSIRCSHKMSSFLEPRKIWGISLHFTA